MARQRRRDPRLTEIGERIAAVIVAEFDAAGLPLDDQVYGALLGGSGPVVAAVQRASLERQKAAYASREERRAAWAAEASAASWEDLQARWGLSRAEMRAAQELGHVQPIQVPYDLHEAFSTPRYYHAATLTDAERAQIAAATLLSRTDAAERLGITPAAFDQLRRMRGLEPADRAPTRAGHMLNLYHQGDVDRLGQALAAATHVRTRRTRRAVGEGEQ